MNSDATNFSLGRDTLASCEFDNNDKKIRVATHSLVDLKCYYYWLLQNDPKISGIYNPVDMKRIVDVLIK